MDQSPHYDSQLSGADVDSHYVTGNSYTDCHPNFDGHWDRYANSHVNTYIHFDAHRYAHSHADEYPIKRELPCIPL
jgi:hypothetical protein